MKTLMLTATLALLACGTEEGKTPKAESDTVADSKRQDKPEPDAAHRAELFASADKVPECGADDIGWLVYVTADKEFMACGEHGWEKLNIKGADGEKGEQGEQGKAGESGATGDRGIAGQSAETLDPGVWKDAITGHYWFASSVKMSLAGAQAFCTNGWRMATGAELSTAIIDGAQRAPLGSDPTAKAWTSDVLSPTAQRVVHVNATATYEHSIGAMEGLTISGQTAWAYCTK